MSGSETKLFISYIPPHKAVSKDTLARWLKEVLHNAGINVKQYSAHSTRSATVSAASAKNIPVEKILQTAGGKSEKTFAKFYKKPILSEEIIFTQTLMKE